MGRPPKKISHAPRLAPLAPVPVAGSILPTDGAPDSAWFDARFRELGLLKSEGARALGMDGNVFGRCLSGRRKVQIGEAIALARLLRVPFSEMVRRLGHVLPRDTVPVVGYVNDRARISQPEPGMDLRVEAPTDSDAATVAVIVRAPNSRLAIHDGMILYYEPAEVVRPDAFGRLSIIETSQPGAPLVGILDRGSIGRARVLVYGGIETLEPEGLISATPVRWQRAS